jgi:hypothetical protein
LWSYESGEADKPRMTLCVPASYGSNVSAEHCRDYASAVAATVRVLEAGGTSVAVWAIRNGGTQVKKRKKPFAYAVQIRELGEPLDLAKIAFAFHPSMLRRLHFAFGEMRQDLTDLGAASDGYGLPWQFKELELRETFGDDALADGRLVCLPGPAITDGKYNSVSALCAAFRQTIDGG